jgi:hypothetical protein
VKTLRAKIIIAGAPGSGKSFFAQATDACITAKQFGVSIGKISETFSDTSLEMELIIWTLTQGRPKESTHMEFAEAAIVLCDLTKPTTLRLIPRWAGRISSVSGNIPIIFVASNVNPENWDYFLRLKHLAQKYNSACFPISGHDLGSVRNIFRIIAQLLVKNHIKRKKKESEIDKSYS